MSFKNMKIPVENNLDEIVVELERLGYERTYYAQNKTGKWIRTCDFNECVLTTLAELKEM